MHERKNDNTRSPDAGVVTQFMQLVASETLPVWCLAVDGDHVSFVLTLVVFRISEVDKRRPVFSVFVLPEDDVFLSDVAVFDTSFVYG